MFPCSKFQFFFVLVKCILIHILTTLASGPGSAQRQAEVLRTEGVEVKGPDSMGEFYVDFSTFGWFPSELPSEAES